MSKKTKKIKKDLHKSGNSFTIIYIIRQQKGDIMETDKITPFEFYVPNIITWDVEVVEPTQTIEKELIYSDYYKENETK